MTVTFAQIEPTTRCNFTCGFCAGRAMEQRDLDWAAFRAFLVAHPDLRHVELQGEGEPLLHPRFFDMLAACKARGVRVSLITNGSLLSPERIERLLGAGVGSIHVSIESADPARFQAIRGGKFQKVKDGLALLIARRRERGLAEPLVGLAVTVLKSTIAGLDEVARLYLELGLDGGVVAQQLQPMPVYSRHYDAAMAGEMLGAEEMQKFITLRTAIARHMPVPRADGFFYYALFEGFDARRDTCPWLARGAYLDAGGGITGCCFMKDEADATHDPAAAAARRAALRDTLEQGEVPAACAGCGTAESIALNRRAQPSLRAVPK
ncbi:MAG: radical SAM protein [Proteobacteria bacterium]|nr:radical SAM protein [Pseudomonadota bacterium]